MKGISSLFLFVLLPSLQISSPKEVNTIKDDYFQLTVKDTFDQKLKENEQLIQERGPENVLDQTLLIFEMLGPDSLKRLKYLVKDIFAIVKHELVRNKNLMLYAKGKEELKWSVFSEEEGINNIIPIEKLPSNIVSVYEKKQLRFFGNLPRWTLEIICRLIREHRYGDEFMSRDVTMSYLPIWAFEMFTVRESNRVTPGLLRQLFPRKTVHLLRRRLAIVNKDEKYKLFSLKWEELPFWVLELANQEYNSATIKSIGHDARCQCNVTLKKFLIRVLPLKKLDSFEGSKDIKITIDKIPQRILTFVEEVFKLEEVNKPLLEYSVPLDDILNKIFKETRSIFHNTSGPIFSSDIEAANFPNWLSTFLEEMTASPNLIENITFENSSFEYLPGQTCCGILQQNLLIEIPKTTGKNSTLLEEKPSVELNLSPGTAYGESQWIEKTFRKKLKNMGNILKFHEIPEWMFEIFVKNISNLDVECILRTNIKIKEILDMMASITMNETGPYFDNNGNIILDKIPLWGIAAVQNILKLNSDNMLEENEEDSILLMRTIKLDELLDILFKIAMKGNKDTLEREQPEEIPKWITIYLSQKLKSFVLKFSPAHPVRDGRKLNKPSVFAKKLVERRIKLFNEGNLTGNFFPRRNELPNWAVDMVKIKFQRYYDKRILMPINLEWVLTPFWVIELVKCKIPENSFMNSGMDQNVTVAEIIDFAIWITNATNNKNEKYVKPHVDFDDVPDWLIHFLWRHAGDENEDFESIFTLNRLLDWAMVHNIRRKWGTDGERVLTYKENLMKLPKSALDQLKLILKECNQVEPPINFQIRNISFPSCAKLYIQKVLEERNLEIDADQIPDILPYWLSEIIQFTLIEEKDTIMAMQRMWTITDIVQWTTWVTKLKLKGMRLSSHIRLADIPDWVTNLLKLMIKENPGDEKVMKYRFSTEELITWGIENTLKKKQNTVVDVSQHPKVLPKWAIGPVKIIIKRINDRKVIKDFEMPKNQLPIWMLDHIENNLKSQKELDFKKVPYGVIELLQIKIQEFNGYRGVINAGMILEDLLEDALRLVRRRKLCTGINTMLELKDLPEWVIDMLITTKKENKSNINVFNQITSLNKIINWSIRNSISKLDLKYGNNYTFKGLPLWLIKMINHKLNENRYYSFRTTEVELPTWVVESISRVEEIYKKNLGIESLTTLHLVPRWVIEFLQFKFRRNSIRMQHKVTMNELLKFSIWGVRTDDFAAINSFVTILDLPDWIFYFLKTKINVNMNDEMILRSTMTLFDIVDMATKNFLQNYLEDGTYTNFEMTEFPKWGRNLLKRKIKLVNEDKIRFHITDDPLPTWVESKIIDVANYIYEDKKNMVTWEIAPYWMVEFLKMKNKDQNNDNSTSKFEFKVNELIDFGLWITNRVNNAETKTIPRKLKLFDIPYWLIEFIRGKIKFYREEEYLLNDTMRLEEILSIGIGFSISKKTCISYDKHLPDHIPKYMHIPRTIKETLLFKVKNFDHEKESKKFQAPNNQLPIWAAEYLMKLIRSEYAEEQEIINGFLWESVPNWLTEFLQYKIQKFCGSPKVMEMVVTINEIVDWAVFITNERKINTKEGLISEWTEIPQWLIEFLTNQMKDNVFLHAGMYRPLQLNMLLNWTISNVTSDALDRNDPSKVQNGLKDIPSNIVNFIQETLDEINSRKKKIKFNKGFFLLPEWVPKVINKTANDVLFDELKNQDQLSVIKWEIFNSWITHFMGEIIKRRHFEEKVMEYKPTMTEIIEFSVRYTNSLINNNGRHIRKIALSDLPEWLIEIIKSILLDAKCNHSALGQTVKFRDLLEIAVHKSIIIQPIKRDEIFREKYNHNRETPSEVENIVQKEINHFNEHRKKMSNDPEDLTEGRRFVNYLTISMSETIQEMVADWHEEIIAEEQGNPWESVPYWAIKFTQSIHDGNKGIRNLAHFKLSLRKIIRWLIVCIQKTKKVLGKDDSVMWNDLPDSILHLIEIVRKEGGNVDAMETKFSVQDIVRAGIFSVIKEDAIYYGLIKTDLKLREIPEKIMDLLVLAISDANNVESVNEFKPSVTVLPSWALKLISNSVADVIDSRNSYMNFLPTIKWELTHSWVIDLLRFLIDKQHTEKEVLMYEFTTGEVISIAVEQTKNRFNFQAVVARDIGLVDIPECVVTFVKDAYKTHRDVDAFLQHRQTIYSLLVWSLKKCSPINTIMFNAALLNNNEVKEEVLPNWAENVILKEIDSYYNFYQPQIHIQSTNPLTYSTAVNFKRMVSNKIKEIEPYETVPAMEIIPYATIKFTQKILQIQKGRRDIMSHSVTVRQILHWVVGFLQTVADSYATNGRVTSSDIPKCIKHFIVDAGNCIEDHHHAMDFVVNLEKFVDYGIKEGLRLYLLGKIPKTVKTEFFEIPSEIVTSFMNKMRNMEEDKDSYILDLITDGMPPWAFQLIDDSRPPPPSSTSTSRTVDIYLSVMPDSHMIDLLKLIIGRLKTREDVRNYQIPFSEFLKFALSYAITHYDMDETDEKLYFRFVDLPFWLMNYINFLINSLYLETDQIMQERKSISRFLSFFMARKMELITDTEIDREISNFRSAENDIQEWITVFLQTKVHEYITAENSIKYEKPKNVIQIWMVMKIINIFEQKLKERDDYMDVQARLEYIPFWIVEYIELQTEVSQGNKFVMDSVTTVDDFVAWVVMRTGCNKNESCYKNDLEWTDLPIWIADYLRVKGEEFGKADVIENNMTTVREIITWGIEYAVSRKVYNNDLKQSEASIEGEWMNWFIHQEIESVNRNKYMKKYENSEIVFPFFLEETVETIVKKHFGLNVSPNNLFSWEITPHWLIEMLKIKLHEHANDSSILDNDIFLSEIIEYAVSLTKHLNDKSKVGLVRKIRVIDLPEWLLELIKFIREGSTKTRISFLKLLTWGIKNSIRSKFMTVESKDFDALTTISDAQWVKDVLLMKIAMNSEGKFRKEFNKPMNYLPVWAIDFIHKEVKSIWHSYAEERPKDVWESIPYWLAQLIQSKLQEFSRRTVMKQPMTLNEVIDWVIWINNETRKDLGIHDRIEKDELFVLMVDFLGITKESGIENKMTLQDIISWALNVTVAKTMVRKDTSSLLHSLKGIEMWALKLINRAISLQNENPKTIGFKFSQNEFPESVKERFKEIIQEIYADKTGFSPSERMESIPYWIEVFVMHKFSHVNSEKHLLEEELTVTEILEFAIQLTQTIQDKFQVGVRSNIRWINIPFWIVELIRTRSRFCDNEDCLTNQRIKLDHLLVWSLRNGIRWTICKRDNGAQNKPFTESEIPAWLKETLSNKLKLSLRDDFITRYKIPLNRLPIWIVECIHKMRLEISEFYGIPQNKINVPFWVVELIQSIIKYHANVKKVIEYRFSIDKMVEWVIWNIKRKKVMLGDDNEIKLNQIPQWAVKVITDMNKGHQIANVELQHNTILSDMLRMSMTFDISGEKTIKYLPYWVLMMLQNKLEYINHRNSSNEFRDIKVELPSFVVEYVFTTVQKKYNISKFLKPIDSLEIIPHPLLEYIKMKLFELNDKQRRVMKRKVKQREIIDYVFWFTKKYMVNSGEMRMDDIPSWFLMYINMKLLVLRSEDAVFDNVITLRDLLDWAIYLGVHSKQYEKVMLIPKPLEILPEWVIQYLLNTLQKVNNDIKRNIKQPNDLPTWALMTIFSLIEIVYKDNYYSLPTKSENIVPNWVIKLFKFKVNEFNGSSNVLSSNITVNDFVRWSMDNALSLHRETHWNHKLELHEVPEAVIDLLLMQSKRLENDQSVFKLNMTTQWILRWAIENNMEKIKTDEKNATFAWTPYSKFFPKWFLDRLKWRIKYSNNRHIKSMFHEYLKPAPTWIKELIKAKFKEHSDFIWSSKHKMTWKNLPTWLKTLVMVNMDEKSDMKLVMSTKMTIDDIIYYSLWFTKHSTDWEENLELSDIPEWSLELYAEIANWNETEENILSKRFKLDEILDCAIKIKLKKYREKQERVRLIDWSKINVHNWVGDYLKQLNMNENSSPTLIPDWVPTVVETVLKEYSGEDFLIKDYILTKYLSDDISARYSSKASMRDIIQVAESLVNTIKIKLKETEESEMYRMNNKTIIPSNDFPYEVDKDLKPQENKGTLHIKFIIKFLEEILEYVKDKIRFLIEDYKKLTNLNAGAFEEWTLDDADFYRSDN